MAIMQEHETGGETGIVRTAIRVAETGARRGWFAAVFSAVAVAMSCVSVYVSTLQGPQLEIYVPQAFQYALDAGGENFTIPITIANSGARSSTVLSIELQVQNAKTNATKRFYGAYLGEYPTKDGATLVRQFTPLAILGRAVFSETVRFYPVGFVAQGAEQPPRIVSGAGEYTFRLKINTAAPPEPSLLDRLQGRTQPREISVRMTLPVLDYRGIMQLRAKEWVGAGGSDG
jgi:hypothetical protein